MTTAATTTRWHGLRLALVACGCLLAALRGQEGSLATRFAEGWRWTRYDRSHGLPSARVLRVTLDRSGTLWAGTASGLAWFDGYRFHAAGGQLGLHLQTIRRMVPFDDERLFVASGGHRFYLVSRTEAMPLELPADLGQLTFCEPDGEGGILFLGADSASPPGQSRAVWWHEGHRADVELPENGSDVAEPRLLRSGGQLWLACLSGLYRFSGGAFGPRTDIAGLGLCATLVGDPNGRVQQAWFRSIKRPVDYSGLRAFGRRKGRWQALPDPDLPADTISGRIAASRLRRAARLADGSVLALRSDDELVLFAGGAVQPLRRRPLDLVGVQDFTAGAAGEVVFATGNGVRIANLDFDYLSRITQPRSTRDIVRWVLEDHRGHLWIARSGGLTERLPDGSEREHELPLPLWHGRPPVPTEVVEDARGRIWVAFFAGPPGLCRWDGERWTRIGEASGLLPIPVLHIELGLDGRLWTFARSRDKDPGLPAGASPVRFQVGDHFEPWQPGTALAADHVLDLAQGRDGSLWFAAAEELARYRDGRWRRWSRDVELRSCGVSAVAVDPDGRAWFCTSGAASALGCVEPDSTLRFPYVDEGGYGLQASRLATDRQGRLVLAGAAQLLVRAHGHWHPVDLPAGWLGELPSALCFGANALYLSSWRGGLYRLRLDPYPEHPPIVDDIDLDLAGDRLACCWSVLSYRGTLSPSGLLTRYRLDGGAWSPWQASLTVSLEDLASGEHRFAVQARSLFGQPGPVRTTEPFEVWLPFHREPIVRTVFGVLLGGVMLLLVLAMRQARARQRESTASRARLEALTNAAQVGIFRADPDGRVTFANRKARELLGGAGGRLSDVVAAADASCLRDAVGTGAPFRGEYRLATAANGWLWLVGQGEPEHDATGHLTGCVGSLTDVTESKEAELERARLDRQLQEVHRLESVGKLAGGIAHDFNNMLQVVLGNCEEALDRGAADDRPALERILFAAQRASQMTRQLLAFSNKEQAQTSVVELASLILRLMPIVRSVMPEGVEVDLRLGAPQRHVLADPGQLEHVVLNLCLNARDAMPSGGHIEVELRDEELTDARVAAHAGVAAGPFVVLAVRDQGQGIASEQLSRIFEPFFTTKPQGEGTGLGLAVVYGVVRAAGGFVEVSSQVGRGSEFRVHLPLLPDAVPQPVETDEPRARGGRETILVAEDEPTVRELVVSLLVGEGYRVLVASDGVEAVAEYERHRGAVDLMVLDVVMPHLGGRGVVERICQLGSPPAFLFSSGYSTDELSSEFLRRRRITLLHKPWRAQDMLVKVREALDRAAVAGSADGS